MNHLACKRSDADLVKMDMPIESTSLSASASSNPTVVREDFVLKVVVFSEIELGMVLSKGKKGEAMVASVVRRSPAARAGVKSKDVIVGCNAVRTSDFNQILWLLRHVERPMHLLLITCP